MIILQLALYCALFTLMVKVGVGNNALTPEVLAGMGLRSVLRESPASIGLPRFSDADVPMTLSGFRFTYPGTEVPIVDVPELTLATGEITAITGANGAGKTSLLPQSLSGGQKQRLAIACALVSGREIILLDEPTSGLDWAHMMETAQILKELKAQGITILVVTHDSELIRACCDRMITIS